MPLGKLIEKREEIFRQAKLYDIQKLWIMVPKGGTFLKPKALHILYALAEEKSFSRDNEKNFLRNLTENIGSDSEVCLYDLGGMEESAALSSVDKILVCERLKNLIPLEDLTDSPLTEQRTVTLEPASEAVVLERIQTIQDRCVKRQPLPADELKPTTKGYKRIKLEPPASAPTPAVVIPKPMS